MAFTFLLVLKVDCLCSLLPPTSVENTQLVSKASPQLNNNLLYTFYKRTVKLMSLKYTFKHAGFFFNCGKVEQQIYSREEEVAEPVEEICLCSCKDSE